MGMIQKLKLRFTKTLQKNLTQILTQTKMCAILRNNELCVIIIIKGQFILIEILKCISISASVSFFIILNGSTSIYISSEDGDQDWISPRLTDDEGGEEAIEHKSQSRVQYGIHVGTLGKTYSCVSIALTAHIQLPKKYILYMSLPQKLCRKSNWHKKLQLSPPLIVTFIRPTA